jgi:hypothetical protein
MNWTVNTAGTLYKYKDVSGASCKIVIIKGNKLLKAVCKGTQVSYVLNADQVSVDVVVRTGSAPRRWCSAFNSGTAGLLGREERLHRQVSGEELHRRPGAVRGLAERRVPRRRRPVLGIFVHHALPNAGRHLCRPAFFWHREERGSR